MNLQIPTEKQARATRRPVYLDLFAWIKFFPLSFVVSLEASDSADNQRHNGNHIADNALYRVCRCEDHKHKKRCADNAVYRSRQAAGPIKHMGRGIPGDHGGNPLHDGCEEQEPKRSTVISNQAQIIPKHQQERSEKDYDPKQNGGKDNFPNGLFLLHAYSPFSPFYHRKQQKGIEINLRLAPSSRRIFSHSVSSCV